MSKYFDDISFSKLMFLVITGAIGPVIGAWLSKK
jgi:hypothetical protein